MQGRDVRSNRMATKDVGVGLTHGAWANGSSWARVTAPLEPTLLPLTSLADDVAVLNRSLDRTEGAIVLAGYACAGAVIALARLEPGKSVGNRPSYSS
jgi:hypothetical protein